MWLFQNFQEYPYDEDLIMNSVISDDAYIWSPNTNLYKYNTKSCMKSKDDLDDNVIVHHHHHHHHHQGCRLCKYMVLVQELVKHSR